MVKSVQFPFTLTIKFVSILVSIELIFPLTTKNLNYSQHNEQSIG